VINRITLMAVRSACVLLSLMWTPTNLCT